MKPELLILRFGELWLKGGNRKDFLRALARRLRTGLKVVAPTAELVVRHDRMEILLGDEAPDAALALARRTPGLARVICAVPVPRDLEAMKTLAPKLVAEARRKISFSGGSETPSFRVASRRSDKRFELRSPDLNRALAEAVLSEHELPVDLRNAQLTLGCEVAPHGCVLWTDDFEGCGGLPVGSAGKALLMLSGGDRFPGRRSSGAAARL